MANFTHDKEPLDFVQQFDASEEITSGLMENYETIKSAVMKMSDPLNDENIKSIYQSGIGISTPDWRRGHNLLIMFPEIAGPVNGLAKAMAGYKVYIGGAHNPAVEQILFNNYDMFNVRYKLALDYLSSGNPHVIAKYRDEESKDGLKLIVAPSYLTNNYIKEGDDIVGFNWLSPESGAHRSNNLRRYWEDGEWKFTGYEWDEIKYPNAEWECFGLSPLMALESQFEIFSLFMKNIEKYYRNGSKTGTVYNFKTPEGLNPDMFYNETVKPFIGSLRKQESLDSGFAHKSHAVMGLDEVFTDQREISKFIDNETREQYKKDVLALFNIPLEKSGLNSGGSGISSDRYEIMQTSYYEEAVKCHADAIDALFNSFVVPKLIQDEAFMKAIVDVTDLDDLSTMRIENKKIMTETESKKSERFFKAFELGVISKSKAQEEVFGFTEEDQELDLENQIDDAIEESVIEEIAPEEEIKEFSFDVKFDNSPALLGEMINRKITKNYKRKKKIKKLIKATDFSPIDDLLETTEYQRLEGNIKDALKQSYKSNLGDISELVLSKDTKKQVETIVRENNRVLGGFLKTSEIIDDLVFISEAGERMARQCGEDNGNPDYDPDVANRVKSAREKIIGIRMANLNGDLDFVKAKDSKLREEVKEVMESITQDGEGNITNLTAQMTALLLAFDKDKSLNSTTRTQLSRWIKNYTREFPGATPQELEAALDEQIDKVVESRSSIIASDTLVTIFGASVFAGVNVFAPRTKTWLRTRSITPRDFHLAQIGVEVPYDDLFPSGEFWSNTLPKCKCGITVKTKVFSDWGGISFRRPAVTIINT